MKYYLRGGEIFPVEHGKPDFSSPCIPPRNAEVFSEHGVYQYRNGLVPLQVSAGATRQMRSPGMQEGGGLQRPGLPNWY